MFVYTSVEIHPAMTTDDRCAPPLLADMPDLIRSWSDLSLLERRDQRAAVSTALRICERPPPGKSAGDSAFFAPMMSCADLNARLFQHPPAAYGLTPASFSNMLSQLRKILRRLKAHEPPFPGYGTLPPAWQMLHGTLPPKHRQIALTSFFRFCGIHAVTPEAVAADTLAAYETWLQDRTLCGDTSSRARATASNWTWASVNISSWPKMPLKRPRMRKQYVLPLSAYPSTLQNDAELYLQRLSCTELDDIFPDDADVTRRGVRRRKPLRLRTIETRRFQLRQALVALVLMGRDPASITALSQMVDPPTQARAIIRFYLDRAGNRRTSQTGGIAEVLRQIARFHCSVDEKSMQLITKWARAAAPDQQTAMSERNAMRLRTLLEPHTKGRLLHLPGNLMKRASDPELRPHAAALLAMYATALELLLAFPMRRSNLAALRLDQHLQRSGFRGCPVTHISLPKAEMKNEQAILWPLGDQSARLLEVYIQRFRPQLAAPGNTYLFPNTKMSGRSAHDLAIGLGDLVEGELGCEFNLHLMRHFTVARHLQHHPGDYETGRRMLGHKNVKTTTDYYAGLEVDAAARSVDADLALDRSATRLAVAGRDRRTKRLAKLPGHGPARSTKRGAS